MRARRAVGIDGTSELSQSTAHPKALKFDTGLDFHRTSSERSLASLPVSIEDKARQRFALALWRRTSKLRDSIASSESRPTVASAAVRGGGIPASGAPKAH